MRGRIALMLIVPALTLAFSASAQERPLHERGFAADKVYQVGEIDSIDLATGALSLVIPIGPSYPAGGALSYQLKLVWSSHVWDFESDPNPDPANCLAPFFLKAFPNRLSNAGMGWMLSLGRLYVGEDPENPTEGWLTYISPDGASHGFGSSLHANEAAQTSFETPVEGGQFEQADFQLGETLLTFNVAFSRDASYLRMKHLDAKHPVVIEQPDGTYLKFKCYATDDHPCNAGTFEGSRWRLDKIADRFGNYVKVTYSGADEPAENAQSVWTIQDSSGGGRSHTITFRSFQVDGVWRFHVKQVDLAKPGGGTASYSFQYHQDSTYGIMRHGRADVNPHQGDCQIGQESHAQVPLLVNVVLPDQSAYSIPFDGGYIKDNPLGTTEQPGLITRVDLPTGGSLGYSWLDMVDILENPHVPSPSCGQGGNDPCLKFVNQWATVATKSIDEDPHKTWDYSRELVDTYTYSTPWPLDKEYLPEDWRVTVTSPPHDPAHGDLQRDDSVYFFRRCSTDVQAHPQVFTWDYLLPFARSLNGESPTLAPLNKEDTTNGGDRDKYRRSGPFISQIHYSGLASGGQKKRSVYVWYGHDQFGGTPPTIPDVVPDGGYVALPRYPVRQKTVYHDPDGDRSVEAAYSDFDGFGHHRTATTTSSANFGSSARVTKTYFNHDPADPTSYPVYEVLPDNSLLDEDYLIWSPGARWILGTYDATEVTEGGETARTEYCFDRAFNSLRAKRTMLGSTHNDHDLLAVYTHDTHGNVTREQYFGGDTQEDALPDYCTKDAGGSWPTVTGEQYALAHTYSYGSLATSQHVGSGFFSVNNTIDPSTGLASQTTDSAGVATDYAYDDMQRLTWVKPGSNAGVWNNYSYTSYSDASNPAKVRVKTYPNGSTSGTTLAEQEYRYDGFGRLTHTFALLPNQTWPATGDCTTQCSKQVTTYNALGWKTDVTEVGSASIDDGLLPKTTFRSFDPFGRPGTVTAPDGAQTTFAYTGVRQTQRTVSIGTTVNGTSVIEQPFITKETYDAFGRLVAVEEPSGESNTQVTTRYTYDQSDHLRTVSTDGYTQARGFTYDKRGFLTEETLPELKDLGGGTRTYSLHDARGHAHQSFDGKTTLTIDFDPAERVTEVRNYSGNTLLKRFTYGTGMTASDRSNGKLKSATRYDLFDGQTGPVTMTQEYTYAGKAGRVSEKKTTITDPRYGVSGQAFTQGFTWDDLGALATETYPRRDGAPDTEYIPARTVTYGYSNGVLTGVSQGLAGQTSSALASLAYHPNGLVASVTHVHGTTEQQVVDHIDADSSGMARPSKIWVVRDGAELWSSGTYTYDGAGNIVTMGSDLFTYDGVSRLRTSSQVVKELGATPPTTKTQAFTYDAFGNMQTMTGSLGNRTYAVNSATNRMDTGAGWKATYNNDGTVSQLLTASTSTFDWHPMGDMRSSSDTVAAGRIYTYAYDADGERVILDDNDLLGTDSLGGEVKGALVTLRGLDAKVKREYRLWLDGATPKWTWKQDHLYRGGQLLASVSSNPGSVVRHYHLDHLGSPRVLTDASGTARSVHTYYPFGEEATTTADAERMKFTGHERDLGADGAGDDVDYMHARYYKAAVGRFVGLDIGNAKPTQPQNWNRYAYVLGNPQRYIDPDGRYAFPWELLDLYSYNESRKEWGAAWGEFVDKPGWGTGANAAVKLLLNAYDSAALLLPAVPAFGGLTIRAERLVGGAIGFAKGGASSALAPDRLQHASRHLTEAGILPNWSKATGERFVAIATGILEKPLATFDAKMGPSAVRGFLGAVNGKPVVVFVFKDGDLAGKVATSFVPNPEQLGKWLAQAN